MSRRRKAIAVVAVVVVAGAATIGCCTPSLMAWAVTPGGHFDATKLPPAPQYDDDRAWIALPSTKDEADVALAASPAATAADAQVDVFYVHSTSSVAAEWNARADDADVRAASIRGGTLIQASAFNACCAVYAPEYRQSTGTAYTTSSQDGDAAIDVAYADVAAAFESFLQRTTTTAAAAASPASTLRPFIVAAHSQGSMLATKLVRERIAKDGALRARLVVAYLIGAPIGDADLGGLHACSTPTSTSCVFAYNARGDGYEWNALEFGRATAEHERERICVNPTLGSTSTAQVPRDKHGGAVFFDADAPALMPQFAASRCDASTGRLVVTDMLPLPKRDAPSAVLLWVLGGKNFHPIEYQLFYVDLRNDAVRRTNAFLAARASP